MRLRWPPNAGSSLLAPSKGGVASSRISDVPTNCRTESEVTTVKYLNKTFTPQGIIETQRANALVERGMALLTTPSFSSSSDWLRWIAGGCK